MKIQRLPASLIMPAKAGISCHKRMGKRPETPAFAGVTRDTASLPRFQMHLVGEGGEFARRQQRRMGRDGLDHRLHQRPLLA